MIRAPFQPLPYLFMYGEQNSGKSIFHEALSLLMTRGVASADRALTNANDFNGELANAVLAHIEEKNLKRVRGGAYNKIKDWVTSPVLWIHKKGAQPYPQQNSLHFIHAANDAACPIHFGDSRIVMIRVWPFAPPEIPKELLLAALRREGPHFTHTLLNFPLPAVEGRLGLPVITTESKQAEIDETQPPLVRAIVEYMYDRDSAVLTTDQFSCEFGPGDWPTDLRIVKRQLCEFAAYLRSHQISIDYPPYRVRRLWPIQITKISE